MRQPENDSALPGNPDNTDERELTEEFVNAVINNASLYFVTWSLAFRSANDQFLKEFEPENGFSIPTSALIDACDRTATYVAGRMLNIKPYEGAIEIT